MAEGGPGGQFLQQHADSVRLGFPRQPPWILSLRLGPCVGLPAAPRADLARRCPSPQIMVGTLSACPTGGAARTCRPPRDGAVRRAQHAAERSRLLEKAV